MDDLPGRPADDTLSKLCAPALDPVFWPAARPGADSAWTTHVPFAHWLTVAHRPRSIVELGTQNGVSYLAFCEAVHRAKLDCRCLAVDTWRGDAHAGFYGEEVYTALKLFHDARYTGFSELLRASFDDALPHVPDGSVDLLHIDGLHTYEAVRHDYESWRPKLSDRALILFHDTNVRERNFGVWRLFGELAAAMPAFEFLHGHGLGVLAPGGRYGPSIDALLHLAGAEASTVRDRFAALGERWRLETESRRAQSRIAALEAETAHGRDLVRDVERLTREAGGRARTARDAERRHTAQIAALTHALDTERRARAAAEHAYEASSAGQAAAEARAAELATALRQAEGELTPLRREAARLAEERSALEVRLHDIERSTAWRVTGPVRRLAARLPRRVRRAARGTVHLAWWTLTGRVRQRLHHRRTVLQQVAALQAPLAPSPDPSPPALPAPESQSAPVRQAGPRQEPVDIVICVHNALNSVRTCLESIVRCTMPPYRIVLIDDGSDEETAAYLDRVAREQRFLLLRNPEPLGYTLAANTGLAAVTAPWVVLLNSDTIVTPDWLDRMWAHGASDPAVGVIGPMSNTASWQSAPRVFDGNDWAANPLPPGATPDAIARLLAGVSLGAVPLPFINGFCYMIRAALLRTVGLLDAATFGAGYGEENDYSIRVREAGWTLAVATDVYVFHAQSRSYSDRRQALVQEADTLLQQKHAPERLIWPQASACRDSLALASVRARLAGAVEAERLAAEGLARFEGKRLAIMLPVRELGGGANVILQESAALQRMGVEVTLLNLESNQHAIGRAPALDPFRLRAFPSPEAITAHVLEDAREYDAVLATLFSSVFWLPLRAPCRFGYYVQDFEPFFFPPGSANHRVATLSYSFDPSIRLLTKTRWNQAELSRRTGRRAMLLGPSVDVRGFAPDPARAPDAVFRVAAMVRPATPRRAPERTLAILDRVRAAMGSRVAFEIFGADDAELAAHRLGADWVHNAGQLDRAGLAALLARSDVFLDASDYQAMGLTALEAMLSGCAVVAPERGGCNEFIRTGVNGILLDTVDQVAAAAAIVRLADDPAALTALRRRAITDANRQLPERAALRLATAMFDG